MFKYVISIKINGVFCVLFIYDESLKSSEYLHLQCMTWTSPISCSMMTCG